MASLPLGDAQFSENAQGVSLASDSGGQVISLDLDPGGLADANVSTANGPNITLSWQGQSATFSQADIQSVLNSTSDSSHTIYANNSGAEVDRFEVVSFTQGGSTFVAVAAPNGNGIGTFEAGANGTFSSQSAHIGDDGGYTDNPAALSTLTVNGDTYLISISAADHSVTSFAVSNSGTLTPTSNLGADQYLPISTPQDVSTVTVLDQSFVVVASAGSSSLTVLGVSNDGTLSAVDQVMDDLGTRFEGVNLIETFEVGDRGFVVAAGQDSGLSLFTILPNGQLLHLESIADQLDFPIDTITDMHVAQVNGDIQLFTVSGSEAGIGQFDLDLGTIGITAVVTNNSIKGGNTSDVLMADGGGRTVDGGNGRDTLIDGAGSDTLIGGWASDVFVLGADGRSDTIADFQPGVDRLDLSVYGFLRSVDQLDIQSTSDGAILIFGDEILVIKTKNGNSLAAEYFSNANTIGMSHVDTAYVASAVDTFGASTLGINDIENPFVDLSGQTGQGGNTLHGGPGDDAIWGNASNQTLIGYDSQDILRGGAGADVHIGGGGFDIADYSDATAGVLVDLNALGTNTGFAAGDTFQDIEGFSGSAWDDTFNMDDAANLVFGATGDDVIRGHAGNDRLEGGDGDDWIDGGAGDDTLRGGTGNDSLLGRDGDDTIYGGAGDDNIAAQSGDDTIYGQAGDDQIGGSYGDDLIYGGTGDDTIGSGAQSDLLYAGLGNDVASGGWGVDEVYGGDGNDVLAGSYGDDIVSGGAGNDSIGGGTGTDYMYAGEGDDLIGAGDDDDFLFGGAGNDFLGGGSGDDVIRGEDGNDKINAGPGDDTIYGGAGSDTYVFNEFTDGEVDTLADFEDDMDIIRLRGVIGRFDGLEISEVTIDGQDYTQITYDGHTLHLADVAADDITAEDFAFIG